MSSVPSSLKTVLCIVFCYLAFGQKQLRLQDALVRLKESRQAHELAQQHFENSLLSLHLGLSRDQSGQSRTVPRSPRKLQTTASSSSVFRRGIRIRAPGAIYFDDHIILQPNETNLTITATSTEFLGYHSSVHETDAYLLFFL